MNLPALAAVPAPAPAPVPAPASELRVAQFNVENFFDTVDDPSHNDELPPAKEYQNKLAKLSLALRDSLGGADLVAMEEVENQHVLDDLMARPEIAALGYKSVFVEGNDKRGIDNAILYRADRVKLLSSSTANAKSSPNLPEAGGEIDGSLLFARPPLIASFEMQGGTAAVAGAKQVTLVVNHLKSMAGEKPGDPGLRRIEEAKFLGSLVDARLAAQPNENIILLGDLNSLRGSKPLAQIANRADGSVRMIDAPERLPDADRYTHIFNGDHGLLDHMFVTPGLEKQISKVAIEHINSGHRSDLSDPTTPNGVSDHDPMVTTFTL